MCSRALLRYNCPSRIDAGTCLRSLISCSLSIVLKRYQSEQNAFACVGIGNDQFRLLFPLLFMAAISAGPVFTNLITIDDVLLHVACFASVC